MERRTVLTWPFFSEQKQFVTMKDRKEVNAGYFLIKGGFQVWIIYQKLEPRPSWLPVYLPVYFIDKVYLSLWVIAEYFPPCQLVAVLPCQWCRQTWCKQISSGQVRLEKDKSNLGISVLMNWSSQGTASLSCVSCKASAVQSVQAVRWSPLSIIMIQ